jgi:uncharacterized OsmC-like protein
MVIEERIKKSIEGVRKAISNDPDQAKAIYRAHVDLVEGVKCAARAQSSSPLSFEEPVSPNLGLGCKIDSGGKELGMVPSELFLVSLGSCFAVGFGTFAALHDVEIHQVSIELSGHVDLRGVLGMDDSVSVGFNRIEYTVTVRSPAPEEVLREVTRLAVERSPMMQNVSSEVDVDGTVLVNNVRVMTITQNCASHPESQVSESFEPA